MTAVVLFVLLSGPGLALLLLTLVNLRAVRPVRAARGGAPVLGTSRPTVSALVPARDEEAAIGACIEALLAEPFDEVLVLDDDSRDRTAAVVAAIAAREPRVRLLRSLEPLPPGWAGKPRACARLAAAARGELLVFVDADVRIEPGGLAGLLRARAEASADVVCALPRQELGSFAERLVVPLLHLIYFALSPLALVSRVRSPVVTVANGQLMLATAEAVRVFGGHAHQSVRGAVVDDQAFCRTAKEHGLRLLFADGQQLSRCRMYRSWPEVRDGFAKNLYLGIGATPLRLAVVLALLLWFLLLPFAGLAAGALAPSALPRELLLHSACGALALLVLRGLLARRFGQPLFETVLLHPLALGVLFSIALESALRAHRGRLAWRGRRYGIQAGVLPEAQL